MRPRRALAGVLAGALAAGAALAALASGAPAATPVTPGAEPDHQTLALRCAVAYLPARSTWVREVQIEWDARQVQALRIDGLAPYSFALLPEGVSTAIDNERIEIDLRTLTWRSDFRGQASGQGRCERSAG